MTNMECCMLGSTVVSRSILSYISNSCLKTLNARTMYLFIAILFKSLRFFFTNRCQNCVVYWGVLGGAW